MKKLVLFIFCVIFSFSIYANEVKFAKIITPHFNTGFFAKLRDFFFGKRNFSVQPFSIGILSNGDIVIGDVDNASIVLLSSDGTIKKVVTKIANIPFGAPVGIWIGENDEIYIVDSVRKGVVVFDKTLSKANIFISDDTKRYTSICIAENKIYLTDADRHKIDCYSLKGEFLFSFGSRGTKPGQFNFPTAITSDNEKLFVVDSLNFRVQIFDLKGNFLNSFGKLGDGGGTFSRPKGICIVHKGIIAVTDVAFDNVQLFNENGKFLAFIGKNGNCNQCFVMPSGIFSQNGLLYICDRWNKRISVWSVEVNK